MFKSIETTDQDDFFDFLRDETSSDQSWFQEKFKENFSGRQSDTTSESLLNSNKKPDDKGFLS